MVAGPYLNFIHYLLDLDNGGLIEQFKNMKKKKKKWKKQKDDAWL